MGVGQWAGIDARGDQTRNVSHINKQIGTDSVGDFAEPRPVADTGISRETSNDHFGLMLVGQRLYLVIVNFPGVVQAILHCIVDFAGKVRDGAMSQVTTMVQTEPQKCVAGLQQRHKDRRIGLRTGMWLDIGVVTVKQGFSPINSQLLNDVDIFAATIVTLARVAFGILVGQHRTLGCHHHRAGIVL